jgi:hypothetical protein
VIRTRGSIGLAGTSSWRDVLKRISPARTSYATPRVSSRTHIDVVSEALAVVRNGSLTRVGSVASVVATTSSISIQSVVYLTSPSHVNG